MSDTVIDLRAKVLIVEDDTIVALDLQGMITRLGYDVVQIVDTAQTALVSAKRFLPDIVLIDMGLAGTPDAVEIAKEIHGALEIPVVFCVGTPDMATLVRAKDLEYATYLLKPINPDSLSTTLDTGLYKYRLERRVRAAEDKFRQLAETCDLLRFFLDRDAAANWYWTPGEGLSRIRGSLPALCRERLQEELVKAFPDGDSLPERVNFLIDGPELAWSVIGCRCREEKALEGLVIPLLRTGG